MLQTFSHPFSPGRDVHSFSPEEVHILEQAALILNVSFPQLLDISPLSQPTYKRQRVNTDVPMTPLFTGSSGMDDAHEKSPLSGMSGHHGGHDGRRHFGSFQGSNSSFLGVSGAQLAECFASFSVCQPCSTFDPDTGKFSCAC